MEGGNIQRKLYFINDQLREMHSKLDLDIQTRIPLENLMTMANILVNDPTIFEIIESLKECQNTSETILKRERDEIVLAHQREIENYTRTLNESELAHTVALAKVQHANKVKETDKRIVQQLNDIVTEQQRTLSLLGIPGFHETFDNKSVITQMHLLSFLLKLRQMTEIQT